LLDEEVRSLADRHIQLEEERVVYELAHWRVKVVDLEELIYEGEAELLTLQVGIDS